jgi:hypothetical protein
MKFLLAAAGAGAMGLWQDELKLRGHHFVSSIGGQKEQTLSSIETRPATRTPFRHLMAQIFFSILVFKLYFKK